MDNPHLIVIAGPNGAGKSTTAPMLLQRTLGVTEFVNADVIAEGLSAYNPAGVAIQAARLLLARIKELSHDRQTFAFETTLASRSFAPWLRGLQRTGYGIDLAFFWLPTPDQAISRVKMRVSRGGHDVPEDVVRRRFRSGIANFRDLYAPLADRWWVFDSGRARDPELLAEKVGAMEKVTLPARWSAFLNSRHD